MALACKEAISLEMTLKRRGACIHHLIVRTVFEVTLVLRKPNLKFKHQPFDHCPQGMALQPSVGGHRDPQTNKTLPHSSPPWRQTDRRGGCVPMPHGLVTSCSLGEMKQ